MKRGKLCRDCWRRGVKTSEKVASPGHNSTYLKNGGQEEGLRNDLEFLRIDLLGKNLKELLWVGCSWDGEKGLVEAQTYS
jgi:hypothetical protein